jgi:saxitoxin biosynthesis operon SxtJ-like protein
MNLTEVRKFGLLFSGIWLLAAAYFFRRGSALAGFCLGGAVFFAAGGLFMEPLLAPIQRAWMAFARALGRVNTGILLGLFFFLVLTPIGLILRLFGKDLLDQRMDRTAKTYWVKRETVPVEKSRYERLF